MSCHFEQDHGKSLGCWAGCGWTKGVGCRRSRLITREYMQPPAINTRSLALDPDAPAGLLS